VGGFLPLTDHTYPQDCQQSVQAHQPHPQQSPHVHTLSISTQNAGGILPMSVRGLNPAQYTCAEIPRSNTSLLPTIDQEAFRSCAYTGQHSEQQPEQHQQPPNVQQYEPPPQNPQHLLPGRLAETSSGVCGANISSRDCSNSHKETIESTDNVRYNAGVQVTKDNVEGEDQRICEPAHLEQKLTTPRDVQKTQIVTKDCHFDDTPMGTDKCEQLKSHRKSTFSKPHPCVKYELKQGMVSKYGNKIKWCAPFLDYDKSVVIKLLTLAK
jgi:hypothetical protein